MRKIKEKIKFGLQNPKFILSYLCRRKRSWIYNSNNNIKIKKYKHYSEYVKHQKSKLGKIKNKLVYYDKEFKIKLKNRIKKIDLIEPPMNVLCLAARMGTEVKSFLELGYFAIGIDLNPGKKNKYVVSGDFHNIQFPKQSVDIVFTNSLDHAFDLKKIAKEIKRVLRKEGFFILEIVKGDEEGYKPKYYESTSWRKINDVLSIFFKEGFKVVQRKNISYPWSGQNIVLKLK